MLSAPRRYVKCFGERFLGMTRIKPRKYQPSGAGAESLREALRATSRVAAEAVVHAEKEKLAGETQKHFFLFETKQEEAR